MWNNNLVFKIWIPTHITILSGFQTQTVELKFDFTWQIRFEHTFRYEDLSFLETPKSKLQKPPVGLVPFSNTIFHQNSGDVYEFLWVFEQIDNRGSIIGAKKIASHRGVLSVEC